MGFVAEYMMKRGGLGQIVSQNSPEVGVKQPQNSDKTRAKVALNKS